MSAHRNAWIDNTSFYTDVNYLEALWKRVPVGAVDMPVIDVGEGEPVVFVPILEHLEFVYARQVQTLSKTRRVILYRRQERRDTFVGLAERAEELRTLLDTLQLEQTDLVGHGDAAMVLFEFALRYPERCRSLIIIAQGADYQIAPHPFIWLLHELFVRLPVEYVLPAAFLRRTVINYITVSDTKRHSSLLPAIPRRFIEEQFSKIQQWPFVYKFSVLPIIHYFDIRKRVQKLQMPVLLINRFDDALSPEARTSWLAGEIPNCAGYHVVEGRERFFMYSRAEIVTPIIDEFLSRTDL